MIIAAAIRTKHGVVHSLPAPARHEQVRSDASARGIAGREDTIGYIDSTQGFVDMGLAREIALASGQIDQRTNGTTELNSRMLWTASGGPVSPRCEPPQRVEVDVHVREALEALHSALAHDAPGMICLAGHAALAAQWKHREESNVLILVSVHEWAMLEERPQAMLGVRHALGKNLGRVNGQGANLVIQTDSARINIRAAARPLADPGDRRWVTGMRGGGSSTTCRSAPHGLASNEHRAERYPRTQVQARGRKGQRTSRTSRRTTRQHRESAPPRPPSAGARNELA